MASVSFKVKSVVRGKIDALRARYEVPFYSELPARAETWKARFNEPWDEYTKRVSSPSMAVALEVAAILAALAETTKPRAILDLGSGFSSFVTRQVALTIGARVKSVDDDAAWLDKTRAYLAQVGVEAAEVGGLDTLTDADRGKWDLVFHDIGRMKTRAKLLGRALDAADPTRGWVLLDDCHKPTYLAGVVNELKRRGARYFSLRELGCDRFGRFAILVAPAQYAGPHGATDIIGARP